MTSLSQHLSILVDAERLRTISDIVTDEDTLPFVDNESPIFSAGFSTAAIWVRCRIENQCGQPADLFIECSTARLSHADWFLVHQGSLAATVRCGVSDVPPDAQNVNQYPSIQIQLLPDDHVDLFFRAESDTSMWLPLLIGSHRQFHRFSRSRLIRDCFLLAMCLMTAAISLVVGFTTRQPMPLLISLVAVSYAITFALFNGHVRAIFPDLPIWWERQFYGSLTMFGLLCLAATDCHVLHLTGLPRWIRVTRFMLLFFSAVFVILQLILEYRYSAKFLFTYIGLASVFYTTAYAYVAIKLRTISSMIWLGVWLVIVANFAVQQLSQSFVAPYAVQTLILPAILCLFLIGLLRNQLALTRTQIQLSNSLQSESEARLLALRAQLEPHFIFNSL
ncbi:MAG: 7TM-DISM domain-containing protein, partial [Planctomycetaceae bacterium]